MIGCPTVQRNRGQKREDRSRRGRLRVRFKKTWLRRGKEPSGCNTWSNQLFIGHYTRSASCPGVRLREDRPIDGQIRAIPRYVRPQRAPQTNYGLIVHRIGDDWERAGEAVVRHSPARD